MIAWRECWLSTPISCDHGIVHLDCWSIKIFSRLGVLSTLIFIFWGFYPMVLLSILAFLCPPRWLHDENVDCPHLYHVIMGSYKLIVGVLKYFIFWGFCPLAFLPILSFLCPPTWSHDENVDCPHLYHVIMWLYTLIVGVLKYFLFCGFCPLWFLSFGLLSYGAFVHFGFSLSAYVIAWWESWLSTPVSYDHKIVHLDCWSIKIFSLLWVL